MERSVRAFAPATVANLGVGFDWLGCAVGQKAHSHDQLDAALAVSAIRYLNVSALLLFEHVFLSQNHPDSWSATVRCVCQDSQMLRQLITS